MCYTTSRAERKLGQRLCHAIRKGVGLLTVFEAMILMLAFATLVLTLKDNKKK
ncbi:MAG: hypothetical protein LBI19_01000 [Oscillospiraceae bacterium]|nr:hypothetical protein [Oscillospiraceae bacterium]